MTHCERKISHTCRYQHSHLLVVVANDYSGMSCMAQLSSALNDVSTIWNLFRRHYCMSAKQIYIFGNLNLDGKMIAWRSRYNIGVPKISDSKKVFFYYSGHGYPDGKFDLNPKLLIGNYYIIDSCYSYLFDSKGNPIIASSSESSAISTSKKVSEFTLNFTNYIRNIRNIKGYLDFTDWILTNKYFFKLNSSTEAEFIKDILS